MPSHFYIIGCQRSGNTLLRLILDSHPLVRCFDELKSYILLANPSSESTSDGSEVPLVGYKIPRFTEQLTQSELGDFGLPIKIKNFYQREPLLFIVRDVRDVICSMINLKQSNNLDWLETHGLPILQHKMLQPDPYIQQFSHEYALAQQSAYPKLALASIYWKMKNQIFFTYTSLGFPIHMLKYTDLTTNPRETIKGCTDFLGLPWDELLLQHHTIPHDESDHLGMTVGNTNALLPIFPDHVKQYKQQLSAPELDVIWEFAGNLMEKFGYSKDD